MNIRHTVIKPDRVSHHRSVYYPDDLQNNQKYQKIGTKSGGLLFSVQTYCVVFLFYSAGNHLRNVTWLPCVRDGMLSIMPLNSHRWTGTLSLPIVAMTAIGQGGDCQPMDKGNAILLSCERLLLPQVYRVVRYDGQLKTTAFAVEADSGC